MAVFENYYDDLTETIGEVAPNCFAAFAGKLYAKKIIDTNEKNAAIKEGLIPGAQKLISAVIRYVSGIKGLEKDRQDIVLELMYKCEWLRDIVDEIKEESTDGSDNRFRVFISYTRREGHMERVERMYHLLKQDSSLYVFKDDHEAVVGEKLTPRLKQEIRECDLFVSILSKKYFDSSWCRDEFEEALKKKKEVTPIVFDCDGFRFEDFKYPPSFSKEYSVIDDILRYKFSSEEQNPEEKCIKEILRFIEKCKKKKRTVRKYSKK